MHLRHMLVLLPLLALAPAHADAHLSSRTDAQALPVSLEGGRNWRYRCHVEQELKAGTISLTRLYTDDGKPEAGDFMRWTPKERNCISGNARSTWNFPISGTPRVSPQSNRG